MSNFYLKFIFSEFSRVSIEMVTFLLTYSKVNTPNKKEEEKEKEEMREKMYEKSLIHAKANCNFDDDKNISFQCDFFFRLDEKVNR